MLLFWERGFEGASMADLTQAMGLNPSSIYAAFGDKHALFSLAVKRYLDSRAQYATEALEEPTLEKVIRALFYNTVAFLMNVIQFGLAIWPFWFSHPTNSSLQPVQPDTSLSNPDAEGPSGRSA